MRIAIDVMGGDNAPQEIIKGALMAQEKNQEIATLKEQVNKLQIERDILLMAIGK